MQSRWRRYGPDHFFGKKGFTGTSFLAEVGLSFQFPQDFFNQSFLTKA